MEGNSEAGVTSQPENQTEVDHFEPENGTAEAGGEESRKRAREEEEEAEGGYGHQQEAEVEDPGDEPIEEEEEEEGGGRKAGEGGAAGEKGDGKERWELPPERWFDYTNFGKVIANTRILPCKTPLDKRYGVPPESEFTPELLLESHSKEGLEIGAVIDLTNTKRYYDSQFFREKGLSYVKLVCPGHEVPGEDLVERFHSIMNNFLRKTERGNKLVAVHCTHGVNRTGYFISRYLMDMMAMTPDDALAAFTAARPPGIERANYVSRILNPRRSYPPYYGGGRGFRPSYRPYSYDQPPAAGYGRGGRPYGGPPSYRGGRFSRPPPYYASQQYPPPAGGAAEPWGPSSASSQQPPPPESSREPWRQPRYPPAGGRPPSSSAEPWRQSRSEAGGYPPPPAAASSYPPSEASNGGYYGSQGGYPSSRPYGGGRPSSRFPPRGGGEYSSGGRPPYSSRPRYDPSSSSSSSYASQGYSAPAASQDPYAGAYAGYPASSGYSYPPSSYPPASSGYPASPATSAPTPAYPSSAPSGYSSGYPTTAQATSSSPYAGYPSSSYAAYPEYASSVAGAGAGAAPASYASNPSGYSISNSFQRSGTYDAKRPRRDFDARNLPHY